MTRNDSIDALSIPTGVYAVFSYVLLVPLFLLGAATIWSRCVSGHWYVCTDGLGVLDFIPPFVHPGGGDTYRVPAWQVTALWYAMAAAALVLPGLAIWIFGRFLGEGKTHST